MTNATTLKSAIKKAIENGYKFEYDTLCFCDKCMDAKWYYVIIFSHDFAKSIWGESFKNNLAIMVKEPEPLRYLALWLK